MSLSYVDNECCYLKLAIESEDYCHEMINNLNPNNFQSVIGGAIFNAIKSILRDAKRLYPLDVEGIHLCLKRGVAGKVDESVYAQWNAFAKCVPNKDIDEYAEAIYNHARSQKMLALTEEFKEYSQVKNYSGAIRVIEKIKDLCLENDNTKIEMVDAPTFMNEWVDKHMKIDPSRGDDIIGIRSGIKSLDDITGGFKPGQLVIIGARTSVGKSTFMSTLVSNMSRNGEPLAVFSLEMDRDDIVEGYLSKESGIKKTLIQRRGYDSEEAQVLKRTIASIAERKIFINTSSDLNIKDLLKALKNYKLKHPNLRICFIDYLQLMSPPDHMRKNATAYSAVAYNSTRLKQIAKELGVVVIALSQLNREVSKEDDTPKLHHLRESGSIEQDADIVLLLHRKQKDTNKIFLLNTSRGEQTFVADVMDLIVAKNRHGAIKTLPIQFYKELAFFSDPIGTEITQKKN